METKSFAKCCNVDDETSNKVSVFEYIVADATGSINVKTLSGEEQRKGTMMAKFLTTMNEKELEPGQWVRFEGAYTEVIDGYLRLVAGSTMTATTGSGQVNTENNRSFVKIVRAA